MIQLTDFEPWNTSQEFIDRQNDLNTCDKAYGFYLTVDTGQQRKWLDDIEAKKKIEVHIDIDGIEKDMTLAEFISRVTREENHGQLQA